MRPKTCTKCDYYSFPLRRCKNGKVNPRTHKQTKEVMAIMGFSYVCCYNKHRNKIATHEPNFLNYYGGLA